MGYPPKKIAQAIGPNGKTGMNRCDRPGNRGPKLLGPILCLILTSTIVGGPRSSIFSEPLPVRYRTQTRFAAALERPIAGNWKGVSLRSILRRLSREREIAILLDRRVDPDQLIDIDTGERSFRSAIAEIAESAHASASRAGNCLVVASAAAAGRLRTVIALREGELVAHRSEYSARSARLRSERATIRWDDLERPADILRTIGRQFGLTISGIEMIPHDLWAGATAPEATAAEALSLVLNQFDLTFEWTDRGAGVQLVALPPTVAIERTYSLRGKSAGEVLHTLRFKVEGLDVEIRGEVLVVKASVEQQESVASLLGLAKSPGRTPTKRAATTLEKQSFTLQAHGVSLRDLLSELQKQGLTIEYDADRLDKAGIDLSQKVSVDLPQLPARRFFSRLLDPYGLTFHFAGTSVVIEPK
jgi:hypothetical protein